MKNLIAAAALSLPLMASAITVTNGSFETLASGQALGSGQWNIYSTLPGWDVGPNGVEVRHQVAGSAQEGNYFIELDTRHNSSISQLIAGSGQVELSFWYAKRPGSVGSDEITFSLGGYTETLTPTSTAWAEYSRILSLDVDGSTLLTFSASGISDSLGGSLDNVSVNAVPEPDSYAMLLAGLGILAGISHRRLR